MRSIQTKLEEMYSIWMKIPTAEKAQDKNGDIVALFRT